MARRRLTPPADGPEAPGVREGIGPAPRGVAVAGGPAGPAGLSAPPPIARVAGEAATEAALHELGTELRAARAEGRLAQRVALERIEAGWLMRDRLAPEGEEFEALVASLRAHGQRVPLEVVEIGQDAAGPRYGLISGWRRLTALSRLQAETGEARFATALAVLRRPETAAAAYLAMVEENEIRAGLSYYERARIVARAAEAGVFAGDRAALAGLFGAASKARRSKIGAFLGIVRTLDGVLRFPAALPERLGLALARALEEDAGLARTLRGVLAGAAPASAEAEQAALADVLAQRRPTPPPAPPPVPPDVGPADATRPLAGRGQRRAAAPIPAAPPSPSGPESVAAAPAGVQLRPGLWLDAEAGRLTLSGPAVDARFRARLESWLRDTAPTRFRARND